MNADTTASLALDTNELQKLSELPTELALQQAAPFLAHLVKDPAFLEAEILPLLEEARGTEEDWYVAHSYKDHTFSLQVFVWPPNTETKIHDHSSWGVYCCAVGSVHEESYERLDDGSPLDHAQLKKFRQRMWSKENGASSGLPHGGGIHRVRNTANN